MLCCRIPQHPPRRGLPFQDATRDRSAAYWLSEHDRGRDEAPQRSRPGDRQARSDRHRGFLLRACAQGLAGYYFDAARTRASDVGAGFRIYPPSEVAAWRHRDAAPKPPAGSQDHHRLTEVYRARQCTSTVFAVWSYPACFDHSRSSW